MADALSTKAEPDWHEMTSRTDWIFDGGRPPPEEIWERLDWSRGYVDLGPSVAGNFGPYWHVPLPAEDGDPDDETVHRLYPKLLRSKWLLIVRRACEEYANSEWKRTADYWRDQCLASTPIVVAARRVMEQSGLAELREAFRVFDARFAALKEPAASLPETPEA